MMQMVVGLQHVHAQGIIHGDIKPDNVILDEHNSAYLIDFGSAGANNKTFTSHYAAPEVLSDTRKSFESDIFSLGLTFLILLCNGPSDIKRTMADNRFLQSAKLPSWRHWIQFKEFLPESAQDLIFRMLEFEASERLTIPQIMCHPFFIDEQVCTWEELGALPFEQVQVTLKPGEFKAATLPDVSSATRRIEENAERNSAPSPSTLAWDDFERGDGVGPLEKLEPPRVLFDISSLVRDHSIAFENVFRRKGTGEPVLVRAYTVVQEREFLKNRFLISQLQGLRFIPELLFHGELSPTQAEEAFHDQSKRFVLVLGVPAAANALSEVLKIGKYDERNDQRVVRHAANLLVALQNLHARGIVLNSTNPEQIICYPDGSLKLCDFSKAQYFDPNSLQVPEEDVTVYSAPESLKSETEAVGYISDIYTLGAILYVK